MHIEHAELPADGGGGGGDAWSHGGHRLCWMGAEQMAAVGVTAGVKKVIAAVEARREGGGAEGGSASKRGAGQGGKGAKRKAAAQDQEGAQPKLSAFFGKKL